MQYLYVTYLSIFIYVVTYVKIETSYWKLADALPYICNVYKVYLTLNVTFVFPSPSSLFLRRCYPSFSSSCLVLVLLLILLLETLVVVVVLVTKLKTCAALQGMEISNDVSHVSNIRTISIFTSLVTLLLPTETFIHCETMYLCTIGKIKKQTFIFM